jgi:hypothetical protein
MTTTCPFPRTSAAHCERVFLTVHSDTRTYFRDEYTNGDHGIWVMGHAPLNNYLGEEKV